MPSNLHHLPAAALPLSKTIRGTVIMEFSLLDHKKDSLEKIHSNCADYRPAMVPDAMSPKISTKSTYEENPDPNATPNNDYRPTFHPKFPVIDEPGKYCKGAMIFAGVWFEKSSLLPPNFHHQVSEGVFTGIQRFIVVRERPSNTLSLPVHIYSGSSQRRSYLLENRLRL